MVPFFCSPLFLDSETGSKRAQRLQRLSEEKTMIVHTPNNAIGTFNHHSDIVSKLKKQSGLDFHFGPRIIVTSLSDYSHSEIKIDKRLGQSPRLVTIKMSKQTSGFVAIQRRQQRLSPWNRLAILSLSLLLLVTFSSLKAADASYAISVDPGDEECYTFSAPSNVGSTSTIS